MGNGKWEAGNGIMYNIDKPFFYAVFANWRSRLNQQLEWKLNSNPKTNTKVVRAGPKYRYRSECQRESPFFQNADCALSLND